MVRFVMAYTVLRMIWRRQLHHFASFVGLCVWLLLAPSLPAQSTWSLVSTASGSGTATTATLWGACYGGGQFVAVGENGTILTSPDGLAWTPRTSGTTEWLTSVAYGYNHYLAVGADRTVLSSVDGITWTPFTAFNSFVPRERLNVVGFDHGRFLAYGEHSFGLVFTLPLPLNDLSDHPPYGTRGTRAVWWRDMATGLGRIVVAGEAGLAVLPPEFPLGLDPSTQFPAPALPAVTRSLSGVVFDQETFTAVGRAGVILHSPDALTWTAQASATTADLQAIVAFNNTLITVGTAGTVLTQNEQGTWLHRAVPTTDLLLALAANDTAIIAVGANGTILRSTATPSAPTFAISPASVTETLGGAASFVARARGSLPLH